MSNSRKFQTGLRRYATRPRLLFLGVTLLVSLVAGTGLWHIRRQARDALTQERAQRAQTGVVPFTRHLHAPLNRPEIKIIQSTAAARAVVRWGDAYFVATSGGLLQLSQEGAVIRHYTVLDGLPESDLTALAVFQGKLYVGTQTAGLLEFDGRQWAGLTWTDRQAQAVTALLERDSRLLVGTFAGGLLEFDGAHFRELRAGATRLRGVTVLVQDATRLWAGTFDDGLWWYEAARWQHFTKNDGLLSKRVTGVAPAGAKLYAATDFGLSEADLAAPQFRPVVTRPTLSGLATAGAQLWLLQDDGLLTAFSPHPRRAVWSDIAWPKPAGCTGARLAQHDGKLWLMSNLGLWRNEPGRGWAAFGASEQPLTDNTIAALALDNRDQLWAGSFRHGLDILARGRRLAHHETPALQEINALFQDGATMSVATSQGVLQFDANLQLRNGLPETSGPPLAVLGLARQPASANLAWATNRGLALGPKRLTTVQGLPSNSLYAVLPHQGKLYAGTLGGLAVVENGVVSHVFKDSNSALSHNWVSALAATPERLFIGTYGGGVLELDAAGELRRVSEKFTVNPNALYTDGARLYAGTLTGAWAYDLRAQTWTQLRAEMPAPTVLSVTGNDRYLYFGTTAGIAQVEKRYFAGNAHGGS